MWQIKGPFYFPNNQSIAVAAVINLFDSFNFSAVNNYFSTAIQVYVHKPANCIDLSFAASLPLATDTVLHSRPTCIFVGGQCFLTERLDGRMDAFSAFLFQAPTNQPTCTTTWLLIQSSVCLYLNCRRPGLLHAQGGTAKSCLSFSVYVSLSCRLGLKTHTTPGPRKSHVVRPRSAHLTPSLGPSFSTSKQKQTNALTGG